MAVHTGEDNVPQQAMAQSFEQKAKQQQQPQQQKGVFSFRNMGKLSTTVMGRTPASEVLSKLNKAIVAVYEEAADKSFEITTIPVDMNSTTTLGVSILIIALRSKSMPEIGVAFHTLIVEGSIEPPAPKMVMINGINTEVIRTVGDAVDQYMDSTVSAIISKAYPQSKQWPASYCVVPRDFNIADTSAVYTLAANALFAASSELEFNSGTFVDLNLSNAERDSNLTVRTTFGNPQSHNAVGQPIRSDIIIDFSAAPINQQQQQGPQVERVSQVARISGFMDIIWDPAQPLQNTYYIPQQQQQNFQRYSPRFVMTALESNSLLTISAQLLALLPALTLNENGQWIQAFRQQSFSNEIDMHDIGAIGIEVNFEGNPNGYGERLDTRSNSFKPEHLYQLINSTFKQALVISLDVPECGPETWYNEVFAFAARGHAGANNAIIEAANRLTNNAFAKYFPQNGRVAIDEFNRIHLGHYSGRDGVRRDIRDIDYLAVANLVGEKDPQIIKDWSDTFLRTNYPLDLRLAARKRIIMELCNDLVITGYGTRVTFEAAFIEALAKASYEAGLTIRPVTSYADAGSYERATPNFAGTALMHGEAINIFSRGMSNAQPVGGYSHFGSGRWR